MPQPQDYVSDKLKYQSIDFHYSLPLSAFPITISFYFIGPIYCRWFYFIFSISSVFVFVVVFSFEKLKELERNAPKQPNRPAFERT